MECRGKHKTAGVINWLGDQNLFLLCCVTSDSSLNLSELQFPILHGAVLLLCRTLGRQKCHSHCIPHRWHPIPPHCGMVQCSGLSSGVETRLTLPASQSKFKNLMKPGRGHCLVREISTTKHSCRCFLVGKSGRQAHILLCNCDEEFFRVCVVALEHLYSARGTEQYQCQQLLPRHACTFHNFFDWFS